MGYTNYLKRPSTFNPNDWEEICSFVASLTVFWWDELPEDFWQGVDLYASKAYQMALDFFSLARDLASDKPNSEKIRVIAGKWNENEYIYIPIFVNIWNLHEFLIYRSANDDISAAKYGYLDHIETKRTEGIDNLFNAIFCFFHKYVYGCTFLSDGFILDVENPEKMEFEEIWLHGHKLFLDWEKEYKIKEQIGESQIGAPRQRQEVENDDQ